LDIYFQISWSFQFLFEIKRGNAGSIRNSQASRVRKTKAEKLATGMIPLIFPDQRALAR
jgi:hypothetical protein|tara:strand:+ start:288 stop:464 length:177 start_codon:yes stop_codon:yes gene_type:complete